MRQRQTKVEALAEQMALRIRSGAYSPDEQLPTEAEARAVFAHLADDGKELSRGTIRAAYARLAEEGLVRSVRGHGWYTRQDGRVQIPLMSIDKGRVTATQDVWITLLREMGHEPETRMESVVTGVPSQKVAGLLRLRAGEQATSRRRVRYGNNEAWAISTGHFPADITYGTPLRELADMQGPSPLAWLMQHGHEPVRDVDTICARMPTPDECRILKVSRNTPMITSYRVSTDRTGRPVRCTEDVFPAHRFELVVTQEYR